MSVEQRRHVQWLLEIHAVDLVLAKRACCVKRPSELLHKMIRAVVVAHLSGKDPSAIKGESALSVLCSRGIQVLIGVFDVAQVEHIVSNGFGVYRYELPDASWIGFEELVGFSEAEYSAYFVENPSEHISVLGKELLLQGDKVVGSIDVLVFVSFVVEYAFFFDIKSVGYALNNDQQEK